MTDSGLLLPDFGGGDTFSTYLYASRNHPDMVLRRRLFSAVSDWVEEANPLYSEEELRQLVQKDCGTPLEPFIISPDDLELAVMLMKIAFSALYLQTRFRIVSRETIGSRGGLVITNNLKSYYAERYSLSRNRAVPINAWTFVPANEPTVKEVVTMTRPNIQSQCSFTDNGISVTVKMHNIELMKWTPGEGEHQRLKFQNSLRHQKPGSDLIRDLCEHSTIGKKGDLFETVGLRIDLIGNEFFIAPKSPESMIRFTAHLMDKSVIKLDPGPEYPGRIKLLIGLQPPVDQKIKLEYATILTEGVLGDWLQMEMDRGPYIDKKDRVQILEWLTSKPINHNFKEHQI